MKYVTLEEFNSDDEFHCILKSINTTAKGEGQIIGIALGEHTEYYGRLNGAAVIVNGNEVNSRRFTITFVEGQFVVQFMGVKSKHNSDYFDGEHGKLPLSFFNAVKAWADKYGKQFWKGVLRTSWESGDYHGFEQSGLLQQVRNQFGPAWLNAFLIEDFRG